MHHIYAKGVDSDILDCKCRQASQVEGHPDMTPDETSSP